MDKTDKKPKILAIVGPTASGKSDLAVELALQFNGEVISADSRQVYRGLDSISGKITLVEMRGIHHHLLDVASPQEVFDVIKFKELADIAIADILSRGKLPILCGGTGFYIEAVVDNVVLPDVPPNPTLREKLEKLPASTLFQMLQELDPARSETIDPENPRRLVRAIEIAEALGKVPARDSNPQYETLTIGIETEPEKLRERINARLASRVASGMIDEARALITADLSYERMESLGLECRYLARFLQGTITQEQMIEQLQFEIWHYAKRQIMWLKRDKKIKWFKVNQKEGVEKEVADFLQYQG
jgi:tRNA dimethylallyltransferase